MDSYDKNWSEIESNINNIRVGTSVTEVKNYLGEPDVKRKLENEIFVYSYQQYGVIAPHWIYDIHISNDTVLKIDSYDW
jgi:hypothetical protein